MRNPHLWETHWFQIRDETLLRLERNLLQKLILEAIEKAGNLNKLTKILSLSYPSFLYVLRSECELVSVKKLKKLADFLKINYNHFNNKILEIKKGKIASIENPRFPFNLKTKEGAKLLGYITSDGTIYSDKKSRNAKRTKYSSSDDESTKEFVNCIRKIFGEVHIQKELNRGNLYLRIGTSIIGDALLKVGAQLGNKTKSNTRLPWLIKRNKCLQKPYLQAIFDDEGSSAGSKFYKPYVIITRYNKIRANKEILEKLDKNIEPLMKEHTFPTGHINKSIRFKQVREILPNLEKRLIKLGISNLLLDESNILSNFGVETNIWISRLTKTQSRNYNLVTDLFIRKKESILKFYKEVNFSLTRKQAKLESSLKEAKWI
ncbi:MAG: hypothetical protein CMH64_03850 [Nanoarchaeota archaeon]|nr:hypothetical protein [Nanoarchaeota archaeon]|tara:strand:+ start:290 stop:1417 length:1128 start_codon:yes stop_codon:yes gene_type:complete